MINLASVRFAVLPERESVRVANDGCRFLNVHVGVTCTCIIIDWFLLFCHQSCLEQSADDGSDEFVWHEYLETTGSQAVASEAFQHVSNPCHMHLLHLQLQRFNRLLGDIFVHVFFARWRYYRCLAACAASSGSGRCWRWGSTVKITGLLRL